MHGLQKPPKVCAHAGAGKGGGPRQAVVRLKVGLFTLLRAHLQLVQAAEVLPTAGRPAQLLQHGEHPLVDLDLLGLCTALDLADAVDLIKDADKVLGHEGVDDIEQKLAVAVLPKIFREELHQTAVLLDLIAQLVLREVERLGETDLTDLVIRQRLLLAAQDGSHELHGAGFEGWQP